MANQLPKRSDKIARMIDKDLSEPGRDRKATARAKAKATNNICSGYTLQSNHSGAPEDQNTAVKVIMKANKLIREPLILLMSFTIIN